MEAEETLLFILNKRVMDTKIEITNEGGAKTLETRNTTFYLEHRKHRQREQECWQGDKAMRNRMNSGEPGGNGGVIVERSGLMSSEMTEQERDGGQEADGETAAELRGGNWQQSCEGEDGSRAAGGKLAAGCGGAHGSRDAVGGKAEGCKQHRGDSAGGLRGKNEPKGLVGWSSAEGPNAAERDAEGDLRGGDEREEEDGGKQVGGERSKWRHGDGALKFKFQSAMHSLRFLPTRASKGETCR
jgi:hypothetical protein